MLGYITKGKFSVVERTNIAKKLSPKLLKDPLLSVEALYPFTCKREKNWRPRADQGRVPKEVRGGRGNDVEVTWR